MKSLTAMAARDESVFFITADLGYGVVEPFAERFPRQFINVGVAEQNMTGVATGLALEGRKVFTYSIANFPTLRCLEQIRNDACYHKANINIVASGGGFSYGALGMTHHATEDLGILRALPGVTIVAPGSAWEAGQATLAFAETDGVGYLRLDKTAAEDSGGDAFALGKARVIREGKDLTLLCTGGILAEALEAAEILAGQGLAARVISFHTLKPLDIEQIVAAALETGGLLTIEEGNIYGGLGSAVAETCLEAGVNPGFFKRIGIKDVYSSIVGSQSYLRKHYGLDSQAIADEAMNFTRRLHRIGLETTETRISKVKADTSEAGV